MSSGPENRFRESLHRKLPPELHHEKMHNPYRGGTFDDWYSGTKADIWVEYKWDDKFDRYGRHNNIYTWFYPKLSDLQKKWGRERHAEGRKVFVIVGFKDGGVLFLTPDEWEAGDGGTVMTKAEIVAWLVGQTMEISLDGSPSNKKAGVSRRRNGKRVQNHSNGGATI